jgi:hypothetical protein
MEKELFSYIRVSTAKQGEHGVSLQEQHEAIQRYAARQSLSIVRSFEEQELSSTKLIAALATSKIGPISRSSSTWASRFILRTKV